MATETKVQDLASLMTGGSATATEEKPTPEAKKDAEEQESEEEESEEESSEESEKEESEKSDKEEKEEESEEGDESADEKEGEESEEESEEEESEEEGKEIDLDAALKEEFEDYGIDSKEALVETLEGGLKALERVEELEKENEELKKKEPTFKSEGQKKIFEYLKDYDPEKFADGLHTFAVLVGMDAAKADPKMVLEQEFLMENPELSIERARKKFNSIYEKKYTLPSREEFDGTDKEYEAKKDDVETDLEMDANKARKKLKTKQQEFKIQSEDKPAEPEVNKEIESGIEKTSSEFSRHLDGVNSLTYVFGKEDGVSEPFEFQYSLKKDTLKQIETIAMTHLKNPAAYDAKGKLKGEFNPEALFQQAAKMVVADQMVLEAFKAGLRKADITTADKIAKKKPFRNAKTGGEMKATSIMGQFTAMANKAAKEKATRKG